MLYSRHRFISDFACLFEIFITFVPFFRSKRREADILAKQIVVSKFQEVLHKQSSER